MATSTPKHSSKTAAKPHAKAEPAAAPRDPAELAAMVSADGVPQFHAVSLDKRYVPARLPTGKVIEVWGDAVIRTPEGDVHPLRAGDEVRKGDVILTAQDGIVQMEVDGSRMARMPFGSDMQGPLAQVNATDLFKIDPTGAGDAGGLYDALRIARINEAVTGQDFTFGAPDAGLGTGDLIPNTVLDAGNQRPAVDVQNISVPESGIIVAGGVQPAAVTGIGIPGFAVFTVHLDSPAVDPVTLKLTLAPGSATLGDQAAGGDFGSSGPFQGLQVSTDNGITWVSADTVAVPEGATTALVRLPLHNDTIDEFDETFTLTAQSLPGSTQTVSLVAQATILDDDDAPNASFTASTLDTSVPEGTAQASVTVTLSGPSGKPISIDWSTADGTATAGQDYTAAAGTLVFAPGETSKTITVAILNDKLVEPDEAFSIQLSNGVNVNTAPGAPALPSATVTITNDDHAPVLVHPTPGPVAEDTPQTGNVLTGATDADGDTVTVVDFTVGGVTAPAGSTTQLPGVGSIVINPDGSYSFTPAPNYDGAVPPIGFTATDGANVVAGDITLTITPVNDAPVVGLGTGNVFEHGLVSAQAATSSPVVATGQIAMSDVEGGTLSAHLVAPAETITANGLPIEWTGGGGAFDTDPLVGSIDNKTYIKAGIDNTGHYKVELLAPIDNVGAGAAARPIQFNVAVSDGQSSTTSTLTVNVQDDAPSFDTAPRSATVQQSDTNLMIVLDTSASMLTHDGISGLTRLESAVRSISQMLDRYDEQGSVMVRLVSFSTAAHDVGATWLTVDQAKAELANVVAGGSTNYDAGLQLAEQVFTTPGSLGNAQNVAYFFSDGLPNSPVAAAQESSWTGFLDQQSMRAVAIGLGNEPTGAALSPIAYDGNHHVNTDASLVKSFVDLDGVLAGTITPQLAGNLVGSNTTTIGGADGAYVSQVTIDGVSYSFNGLQPAQGSPIDPNTHVLTVVTANHGTVTVDMDDGSYGYTPAATGTSTVVETVAFTVSDRDGDTLSSSLVITVPPAPTAQAGPTVSPLSVQTADATVADAAPTLHASPLSDVFSWTLADATTPGMPGITHVLGFDGQAAVSGGDVLNLQDLLQGEAAGPGGSVGNLDHYLDFSVIGSGAQASTQVQVSSRGGFSGGQVDPAAVDHVISLDHVDLRGALGVDGHAANQQIIEAMLRQGKLVVDSSSA